MVSDKCQCPSEVSPADKFVLANIDPFHPKCFGAKIPDTATIPSNAITVTENYTCVPPTATQNSCWAFFPNFTESIVPSIAGANTNIWAWPTGLNSTDTSDWGRSTDFRNIYENTRPVAHGIRISSPVAPTSATGFVHIAVAFESWLGATTWPWPTTPAGLSGYQFYKRVTLASLTQTPLTLVNKYTDETAFRYSDSSAHGWANIGGVNTSGNAMFHIPWSWGVLLIAVEGVNSANPLQLEMILHHESIPKSTSIVSGSNAAPSQPSVLASVAHMSANTDFAHTEAEQDTYVNQAIQAASEGARAAGDYAFESIVRPAAYGLGQQAAYAAMHGLAALVGRGIGGVNNDPNRLAIM